MSKGKTEQENLSISYSVHTFGLKAAAKLLVVGVEFLFMSVTGIGAGTSTGTGAGTGNELLVTGTELFTMPVTYMAIKLSQSVTTDYRQECNTINNKIQGLRKRAHLHSTLYIRSFLT